MSSIAGNGGINDPKKDYIALLLMALFVGVLLLWQQKCHGQEYSKVSYIVDNSNNKNEQIMSGTCASPDGANKEIWHVPLNYQELFDSSYCYTVSPNVKNLVRCYTLTSPGTSLDFNAGYIVTGCATLGLNYCRLYTSSPACVLVNNSALGTVNGLSVGANYTWCISLSCTGPGPGFSSFCPYYRDVTVLPVTILNFICEPNRDVLFWSTASEVGVEKYVIDGSSDGKSWHYCSTFKPCCGEYAYDITGLPWVYYKLLEYDYNVQEGIDKGKVYCDYQNTSLEAIYEVFSVTGELILKKSKSFVISDLIASNGVYILRVTRGYHDSKIEWLKIVKIN